MAMGKSSTKKEETVSEFSEILPKMIFLFCMEHPLSPELAEERLGETGLFHFDEKEGKDVPDIKGLLEDLRIKGILYKNPDSTYELARCVENNFRSEISEALGSGARDTKVSILIKREARNFISRAKSVRESFEKDVFNGLIPEYHDLTSSRARSIVQSLWDEIDHRRIYNSLHSIFDMLPVGIIDFGIAKDEIALEERFFRMTDDQMCDHMLELIAESFEKHRKVCECKFRRNRAEEMPVLIDKFRKFLNN